MRAPIAELMIVVCCGAGCAATPSSKSDALQCGVSGAHGTAAGHAGTSSAAGASGAHGAAAGSGGPTDFGNPSPDASIDPSMLDADVPTGDSGAETCDLGSAGSFATNESLDLFGQITYFNAGKPLPKGRYRVQYDDGCMQYMIGEDWAVHAVTGKFEFWMVGDSTNDRVMTPPGTVGYLVGSGGYATFEECVAANKALPPVEMEFEGGKLGIWLQDDPYADNLAGKDGRNPSWTLTLLGSCTLLE